MRTNRRQFLELASAVGASLPFTAANSLAQQLSTAQTTSKRPAAGPLRPFDGQSLKGWRAHGPASWSAAGGELLAHGTEGWLELEQGFQDFVLRFSFRAGGGEVGLLMRNAPDELVSLLASR